MGKVGIIGGGIIGIFSAYYLQKAGHQVTIIDKGDLREGCSFGNAGMIVPSHFIPLAAPGMIAKGIRWMFNSSSPFYVRPRLSTELLRWGYLFNKSATHAKAKEGSLVLRDLSLYSKTLYQQLDSELPFGFDFHDRGLLMLYQTAEREKEEIETAHLANELGIEARILSAAQVQELEPDVIVKAKGGVYFPGDAHMTPQLLMRKMIEHLKNANVSFIQHTEVEDFVIKDKKIQTVRTNNGGYAFDEVVLASGSWSGKLAKQLQLTLPMQAGKGYSFTLENVTKNVRVPSIFLEARVAVTPMGGSLRFGGTMEITGLDHSISMNRVKGIVDSIPRYYPEMKVEMPSMDKVWHGLRPCSPDGLPYLGRSSRINNLVIATGHAMLGISLGPGTGKIVGDLVDGQESKVELVPFNPERYA
ncbi:MAG TPA: FAD-dependent oxidoreductase [Cyclobacteriaceae bacterium]